MGVKQTHKPTRPRAPKAISQWPGGAHALAALGAETERVVADLLDQEEAFNLFSKVEDELKSLAQALSAGWSDAQAASVVSAYAQRTNEAKEVDIKALCRWVSIHANDAEAVIDCMTLTPPEDIPIIKRWPRVGSQKIVYRARWRPTLRDIVLKRLTGPEEQQREVMERESQTHPFSMVHPNIIETHCLTNVAGEKFLAEELLPLVLNDDWMAGGIQEAANLLYDIGKALDYIHEELKLVHGDVKPDNIGSKDGHYILLDFGICRPIRSFRCTATATGSLRTRAPELLETDGYPDPPKVDVWALAATVYKSVTGRFPFIDRGEVVPRVSKKAERSSFEEELLRRIRIEWDQRVDLGSVPEPLCQVLKAALVRDPEARANTRTILSLCEKHLSGYLRGGKGDGRISEMEGLQQLVRYLPRDGSLRLMPLSSKQILTNRLDSYRQMGTGDPQTLGAVEELLAKLR